MTLAFGVVSAWAGQSLSFPIEAVARRMQVSQPAVFWKGVAALLVIRMSLPTGLCSCQAERRIARCLSLR